MATTEHGLNRSRGRYRPGKKELGLVPKAVLTALTIAVLGYLGYQAYLYVDNGAINAAETTQIDRVTALRNSPDFNRSQLQTNNQIPERIRKATVSIGLEQDPTNEVPIPHWDTSGGIAVDRFVTRDSAGKPVYHSILVMTEHGIKTLPTAKSISMVSNENKDIVNIDKLECESYAQLQDKKEGDAPDIAICDAQSGEDTQATTVTPETFVPPTKKELETDQFLAYGYPFYLIENIAQTEDPFGTPATDLAYDGNFIDAETITTRGASGEPIIDVNRGTISGTLKRLNLNNIFTQIDGKYVQITPSQSDLPELVKKFESEQKIKE